MICERCDGKGIVLCQDNPQWRPASWDGSERRKWPRKKDEAMFKEVPAPFYMTCDACSGLGRILPGLLSHSR
jgi:hypothetical protein